MTEPAYGQNKGLHAPTISRNLLWCTQTKLTVSTSGKNQKVKHMPKVVVVVDA